MLSYMEEYFLSASFLLTPKGKHHSQMNTFDFDGTYSLCRKPQQILTTTSEINNSREVALPEKQNTHTSAFISFNPEAL